ncbi:M23 family peptidase [Dyadobacter luteus]|uniref:M23 family peptidase n=1 Tax=Dyadobacter luteus TaxID=2259619 RepID=A0A3D8Y4W6_9BACT|nr:M23 family metallopeptidase [Dyadobacter luteus]REA57419.1 M23 family peptidase [Dyadobacter luteus]
MITANQVTKLILRCISAALAFVYMVSCKPVPVSRWFPVTPQEHYEQDLYKSKAEKTAAGQTWFRVGKEVLTDTLFSSVPLQERFFLGDSLPAQSIRFKVPQGRKLLITSSKSEEDSSSQLFVEVYRSKANGKPQRIEYLKTNNNTLTISDHQEDTLVLRLQTGLNERLKVAVTVMTLPTLVFPVAGHGIQSLMSFWGAQRDGGSRSHEGIDIKAPRGTPVVASEDGWVTQTGTNNLGGKIVFLSASGSPYSLYYAHLDSQLVSVGKRVIRGDTLGLVGNTGNAITTSPHLHFGIYARGAGAVDPFPFINDKKEKVPGLPVSSKWLGDTVRIQSKVNLFSSPAFSDSEKIRVVAKNETVRIIGQWAKGYRVELIDGTKGYITMVGLKSDNQISENRE